MSLTANLAGSDWYPHRRTARLDDRDLYGRRTMSGLVRDLGGVLGLSALALLWMAGTAPVLAIPIEIFGISPMAVTARWAVLPLAVSRLSEERKLSARSRMLPPRPSAALALMVA